MVDIVGVKVRANFEVIHIVEDADPYPVLLRLDWVIYMGGIINLKKRSMFFENEGTRVIFPLDPVKGEWYTEPMHEEEDVDNIYKLIAWDEDWINPTANGVLCWEKDSEWLSDSDGEIENWQNRLHDVFVLRCLRITKSFRCISSEVRELSYFDGFSSVRDFL